VNKPDPDPADRFIEINGLWFEIIPPRPWPADLPELSPEEQREAAQRYIEKHYGFALTDWQADVVTRIYGELGGDDEQAR
jgi:hypothetical protein